MTETMQRRAFGTMLMANNAPAVVPKSKQETHEEQDINTPEWIKFVSNSLGKDPMKEFGKELFRDFLFFTPPGWIILLLAGIGYLICKFSNRIVKMIKNFFIVS